MTNPTELKDKFWKALDSDKTVMLSLAGRQEHGQPMTAMLGDAKDSGPIWFFSAKDTDLVRDLDGSDRAILQLASKGHDLFASVEGTLAQSNDRAMIDKLWNPFVAAWYQGGKDDPNLQLLRFDPGDAQIWLNENSLFAGLRILLGRDPKKDYQDKVANVRLS